jgi:hypothetical protein
MPDGAVHPFGRTPRSRKWSPAGRPAPGSGHDVGREAVQFPYRDADVHEARAGRGRAVAPLDEGDLVNYLRRMQTERPVVFWIAMMVGIWLAFRLALIVVAMILGPFSLPSWAPIAVVIGVLVLIARRQQR